MASIACDLETDVVVLPALSSGVTLERALRRRLGRRDRAGLVPALRLTTAQRIVLAQTVGYPDREA
jgi:hypothetical protein